MAKQSLPLSKKILFSLLPLIVLCVIVELCFWAFTEENYKVKLGNLLAYTQQGPQADNIPSELTWPDHQVLIRVPDTDTSQTGREAYVIGGRTIPDADPHSRSALISPKDVIEGQGVFIIGGSSAYGFGYPYHKTFAYHLQRSLGQEFQVYNASQVGWHSGQLAPVVKRVVDNYRPRMVILFLGNNEFVNWSPATTNWAHVQVRQFYKAFTYSHALSYIGYHALMGAGQENLTKEPINRTGYFPHGQIEGYQYALKHPMRSNMSFDYDTWMQIKQSHLKHFEQNLNEMISYCAINRVPVVLMNLPFNYRLSPAWKHPAPFYNDPQYGPTVTKLVNQCVHNIETGDLEEAMHLITKAIQIEPEVGMLHYLRAHILELANQHDMAEEAYERAREYKIGNLGSVTSINNTIGKFEQAPSVIFIDLKTIFDQHEHQIEKGYYNQHLIHDDCHPTVRGHAVIANAIIQTILARYPVE